MPYSFLLINL
jgi:elongation factor 1-alpha